MTITLSSDIQRALDEEARKRGVTPEQLALESLRERFVAAKTSAGPSQEPETLAQFLAGHLGVLHSSEHVPGGARMSLASGRKFAMGLLSQQRRQGP